MTEANTKIILIADVISDIGLATAILLRRSGHLVYGGAPVGYRFRERPSFEVMELDLRSDKSIKQAISAVLQKNGRIDVLINNASISVLGALEETSIRLSNELFQVNFFSALRLTYEVLPFMRSKGSGRILNISSLLGILPGPFMGMFAASQFAIEGWSSSLDEEVRGQGIRVSTIRLGVTESLSTNPSLWADRPLGSYRESKANVMGKLRKGFELSLGPEIAAEVISRALVDPVSKQSYSAGLQTKSFAMLRRFAPGGLLEFLWRRAFGLK